MFTVMTVIQLFIVFMLQIIYFSKTVYHFVSIK